MQYLRILRTFRIKVTQNQIFDFDLQLENAHKVTFRRHKLKLKNIKLVAHYYKDFVLCRQKRHFILKVRFVIWIL